MFAVAIDAKSFSFLVFLFVCFPCFWSLFPRQVGTFLWSFPWKPGRACVGKNLWKCVDLSKTGPPGVFNSQTKFTFRIQKFIKIATCIFLPVSSSSSFWSWLLFCVSICLSGFDVMVCPVTSVLRWIKEKSFSLGLAFFPLVIRTPRSLSVGAEIRKDFPESFNSSLNPILYLST